jgi:hypothetical protein
LGECVGKIEFGTLIFEVIPAESELPLVTSTTSTSTPVAQTTQAVATAPAPRRRSVAFTLDVDCQGVSMVEIEGKVRQALLAQVDAKEIKEVVASCGSVVVAVTFRSSAGKNTVQTALVAKQIRVPVDGVMIVAELYAYATPPGGGSATSIESTTSTVAGSTTSTTSSASTTSTVTATTSSSSSFTSTSTATTEEPSTTPETIAAIDDCKAGALLNFDEPIMEKTRTAFGLITNADGLDVAGCAALCNTYGEECISFVHRGASAKCKLYANQGTLLDTSQESFSGYYVRLSECRSATTTKATVASSVSSTSTSSATTTTSTSPTKPTEKTYSTSTAYTTTSTTRSSTKTATTETNVPLIGCEQYTQRKQCVQHGCSWKGSLDVCIDKVTTTTTIPPTSTNPPLVWDANKLADMSSMLSDGKKCYIALFDGEPCTSNGGVYKITKNWYDSHFGGPIIQSRCGKVVSEWTSKGMHSDFALYRARF